MTKTWFSQVVSSFDSIHNRNFDTVCHRKLLIKSWYNSKNLCEYCRFFLFDFFDLNCANNSRPKFDVALRPKCVDSSYRQIYTIVISEHFGTENHAGRLGVV